MSETAISSFKDLLIWRAAMDLTVEVYRLTRSFPASEMYGLTNQIRRSAASIAANIAEGHGRESTGSFVQYLRIAQGSLKELETHLILARRVELISTQDEQRLCGLIDELGRMIRSMIRSLQKKLNTE